ncbi:sugar nucleotide-binding protein [Nocardioides jishulii]|uniref:dTDP-4-dehydrorhamnose reductase n=1 Tax=Nocardioides jishulii TaxID=2575440 RepID=A0A4U2YSV0_9ACTN|nr:bifunctional dTDP-4-dehydrorhamnose 3,5-epimerase family protein/NAD(P)-dependent oxidoreductase [Nocardioides jishulii]QCX26492.1 sugar nucleotide-binding protein [Nocardioides jishulii]TKI63702.1 NAD-dependent epimerase/dehydratase family protein [Nocardioides jishulii]
MSNGALPRVETTPIPGLLVVRLDLRADARGFFKENWQREKMLAAGLPDFGPVQNNVSFNTDRGVTRGIHTEPWDKFISLATGRIFAAWVDMRAGASFGATFTLEMDPSVAVFVPRGVGNSYQTLVDGTAYTYLVNQHWREGLTYPALALDDPTVAIVWPIPLAESEISEKDRHNPRLDPTTAIPRQRPLVIGGGGQLGRALAAEFDDAHVVTREELDLTDEDAVESWDWRAHDVVLNAAAFTAVDAAETPEGRRAAWATNAAAPARLAALAREHGFTLVHFSTDYVFDGLESPTYGYTEESPLSPLGVYGQSKAAGDLAVAAAPHHYVIRTSWVIGEGSNFVATMRRLAEQGVDPSVVDDQLGRLTFTGELTRATRHLLESGAPWGPYNVTNSGPVQSWHEVARDVFSLVGADPERVSPTTTEAYVGDRTDVAPRPARSVLDLSRLAETGFVSEDAATALRRHLA